mgnify:FL=1
MYLACICNGDRCRYSVLTSLPLYEQVYVDQPRPTLDKKLRPSIESDNSEIDQKALRKAVLFDFLEESITRVRFRQL